MDLAFESTVLDERQVYLCRLNDRYSTMVILKVISLAVVLLGLGFAGIAIKIWAKKDGEFSGTCASQSPYLNSEGESCAYCGATPEQKCKNEGIEPA